MRWISYLFRKMTRMNMRVSILTVFLSLTLLSFCVTLVFLYYKTYESIAQLAKSTIRITSKTIFDRVNHLFTDTQNLVQSTAGLLTDPGVVSAQNSWLHSYMLAVAASYPDIPYLFIGMESGEYLEVGNLALSLQTHFFSDASKPLPASAMYEWQSYELPQGEEPSKQIITYYDEHLKPVASETILQQKYDPRTRPWYLEAKEAGHFDWTHIYKFFDTGDPGITATQPLYDAQGKLAGVLGADLAFRLLSTFFVTQQIGKTGKPFILDEKGSIVVPYASMIGRTSITTEVVGKAYQTFMQTRAADFEFNYQDVRYLAHIDQFPVKTGEKWLIAIIVPFNDIFGALKRAETQTLYIVLLISLIAGVVVIYFAKKLSDPIRKLAHEVDRVRALDLQNEEQIHSRITEIHLMASSIHAMKLALRSFIRYVPKEIVKQLLSQNKEIALGGEKKEITVFFSDIADFSTIVEEKPIEVVMPLLAEYLDGLSKIILEEKGTIDKYIGDSVMAFWGAPLEMPEHAAACALAALRCKQFVEEFNERNRKEGKPELHTRFGINTGMVIVGNIGTPERINYTLVGDAVNSAARLQVTNKIYHTHILISDQVYQKMGDGFLARPLDVVEVKGKKQKIAIYELMAIKDEHLEAKQIELCQKFTEALHTFQQQNYPKAKFLFTELQRAFPEDFPTKFYLERLSSHY